MSGERRKKEERNGDKYADKEERDGKEIILRQIFIFIIFLLMHEGIVKKIRKTKLAKI